jgi:hypothetical protein
MRIHQVAGVLRGGMSKKTTLLGLPAINGFAQRELDAPSGLASVTTMSGSSGKIARTTAGSDSGLLVVTGPCLRRVVRIR